MKPVSFRIRKNILFVIAALMAGPNSAGSAVAADTKVVLAVGGKATLYYLPLTLAERLGYFADEGLNVEIHDFPDANAGQSFGGSVPAATPYSRIDSIERNPQTIQALTNAIVRALLWLRRSTIEDVLKTVPEEYLLGDKALYAAFFERLRATYSKDGLIPRKGVDRSYKVLLEHNPAVRRALVIWIKQTYTNAFVEKALRRYAEQ